MKFNVPYIPDEDYTTFLCSRATRLYACHFSLETPVGIDARVKLVAPDPQAVITGLQALKGTRKYLLLNSRFQRPEVFPDPGILRPLVSTLDQLLTANVIHGIVFADFYFLRALSATAPSIAAQLEAIPSINLMMDTATKLSAVLAYVADTRFKLPDHVPIDRSLNRNPSSLEKLRIKIHREYPQLKLELLANEGCLYQCPFKLAHDAYIALANIGRTVDTYAMNRDFGCIQLLRREPQTLFKSPFIRPEDVHRFATATDIIKICGRTLGAGFLRRTTRAYLNGTYAGNLLDLMDSMNWLADAYEIGNSKLPRDFHDHLCACDKFCDNCAYCNKLFSNYAVPKPERLDYYKKKK